jgi:hypothetical protein
MQDEVPGPDFAFAEAFLNETLTGGSLDVVVMHSYNNDGGDDWAAPGFLNQTRDQAAHMLRAARAVDPRTPLWCGECGPHNGGGLENVTDRFISSFYYADALGGLAQLGLEQMGRQTLVGSYYGLLDMQTFGPFPDFFTAVAWRRVMGSVALNATAALLSSAAAGAAAGGGDALADLHVYAHCAREYPSAVALAFINVNGETTFDLSMGDESSAWASRRLEYVAPRAFLLLFVSSLFSRAQCFCIRPHFAGQPRIRELMLRLAHPGTTSRATTSIRATSGSTARGSTPRRARSRSWTPSRRAARRSPSRRSRSASRSCRRCSRPSAPSAERRAAPPPRLRTEVRRANSFRRVESRDAPPPPPPGGERCLVAPGSGTLANIAHPHTARADRRAPPAARCPTR